MNTQCTAIVKKGTTHKSIEQVAVLRPADPLEARSGVRAMPELVIRRQGLELLEFILLTSLILQREQLPVVHDPQQKKRNRRASAGERSGPAFSYFYITQ